MPNLVEIYPMVLEAVVNIIICHMSPSRELKSYKHTEPISTKHHTMLPRKDVFKFVLREDIAKLTFPKNPVEKSFFYTFHL